MRILIPLSLVIFLASCGTQHYYVVRHAEKAIVDTDSMSYSKSNPPLSEAGQVRAFVLRDELKSKHIEYIFSTSYHRTIYTAKPLSDVRNNMPIQAYSPSKDSLNDFITKLKGIKKGNVLVVGHSNTVDDIVNALTGQTNVPGDLDDKTYDNLYIITRKRNKMMFEQRKYGYPSNPE